MFLLRTTLWLFVGDVVCHLSWYLSAKSYVHVQRDQLQSAVGIFLGPNPGSH